PPIGNAGLMGAWQQMPSLPDHWTIIEEADETHPFRLATSPSRNFLNTTFNETPSSKAGEGAPTVMIHPADAAALGIADRDPVTLGNMRGETTLTARLFDGLRRGVLIAESIHPNKAHIGGRGINTLTGSTAIAPIGGAAFAMDFSQTHVEYADMLRLSRNATKPSIARVGGACMAGGMGLLCMTDMAGAADRAMFGLPEVKVGVFPMQVMSVLQSIAPRRLVNEWALTGEPFDARTAQTAGLVNYVVP